MQFFETEPSKPDRPVGSVFPYVTLERDSWDDFGYKATFRATVHVEADNPVELGEVKILREKQGHGRTELPSSPFPKLTQNYCSLGQELNYYRRLALLPPILRETFLRGLRDAAFDEKIRERFEASHEGFRVSLTRFGSATTALVNAPALLRTEPPTGQAKRVMQGSKLRFSFETPLAKDVEPVSVTFDFTPRGNLPNRVNVVIGYNGTGKTQLLSNLATLVSGYGYRSKEDLLGRHAGRYIGQGPRPSKAVVVSYSAFDTFEIPGRTEEEQERLTETGGAIFDYVYCGLRERTGPGVGHEAYRLKTHSELLIEFKATLHRIIERGRLNAFLRRVLAPLACDASFRCIGFEPSAIAGPAESAAEFFGSLSTGHKIVLMIAAQLASHIDEDTLVIVDEPEAHLHPPLLASLLHALRECLDEFRAYAVIATHSPVVLQETPARYVQVIRRESGTSRVAQPSLETFGENIGLITQEVFNLDDSSTDWHRTLQELAKNKSIEQIEKLFGRELGFTARSYVLSVQEDENYQKDEGKH